MMPKTVRDRYLARLNDLIREGEEIYRGAKVTPEQWVNLDPTGGLIPEQISARRFEMDDVRFMTWRTSCVSIIEQLVSPSSPNWNRVRNFAGYAADEELLKRGLAVVVAVRDELERGFLDGLGSHIEAALTGDYMGQAERLLGEGIPGQHDHVPAAVLAGAILERTLRMLCENHSPPIPTMKRNDEPFAMNALIDALRKTDAITETWAKQLRAWADIRNHAAHGRFDQFNRPQVEAMIPGIRRFIDEHGG